MSRLSVFIVLLLIACKGDPPPKSSETPKTVKAEDLDQEAVNQLFNYYYSDPSSVGEVDQNAIIDYAVEKALPVRRSPTGLYYWISKEGEGQAIQLGDKIAVDYKGYFFDGNIFDSSYERGKPIEFKVGSMINGWNEVLTYVNEGSSLTVLIPSRLAYGEEGFENIITPNTPIAFDIEVLHKIDVESN